MATRRTDPTLKKALPSLSSIDECLFLPAAVLLWNNTAAVAFKWVEYAHLSPPAHHLIDPHTAHYVLAVTVGNTLPQCGFTR